MSPGLQSAQDGSWSAQAGLYSRRSGFADRGPFGLGSFTRAGYARAVGVAIRP
jgi:hypothetical protein